MNKRPRTNNSSCENCVDLTFTNLTLPISLKLIKKYSNQIIKICKLLAPFEQLIWDTADISTDIHHFFQSGFDVGFSDNAFSKLRSSKLLTKKFEELSSLETQAKKLFDAYFQIELEIIEEFKDLNGYEKNEDCGQTLMRDIQTQTLLDFPNLKQIFFEKMEISR